jgi:hypothetical protein
MFRIHHPPVSEWLLVYVVLTYQQNSVSEWKHESYTKKVLFMYVYCVLLRWLWDIGLCFKKWNKKSSLISTFATTFARFYYTANIAAVFYICDTGWKVGLRFKSKYLMWIAPICCCVVSRFQAYWEYFLTPSMRVSELMLSCVLWVPLYGSNFSNMRRAFCKA